MSNRRWFGAGDRLIAARGAGLLFAAVAVVGSNFGCGSDDSTPHANPVGSGGSQAADASSGSGGGANTGGDGGGSGAEPDAGQGQETTVDMGDADLGADAPAEAMAPAFDREAVKALMTKVAKFELGEPQATTNNDWIHAAFYAGLMATYRTTKDTSFRDAAKAWGQANDWDAHQTASHPPRFADNEACIQTYAELYQDDPVPANTVMLDKAKALFDAMVAGPMPSIEKDGLEWWWCDALFMAPPAIARVGSVAQKPQYFDMLHTKWSATQTFLYDTTYHLFYRDGTYLPSRNGGKNVFWSRGNGWVMGGLVRVLEYLPADNTYRGEFIDLFKTMSGALAPLQTADGTWHSDLLKPDAFPNPETSGTAFFTYAMAWGIHHGMLDRAKYLPIVTKAWTALVGYVTSEGQLQWVQAVGKEPGPATISDHPAYGPGALLLAGSEIVEL